MCCNAVAVQVLGQRLPNVQVSRLDITQDGFIRGLILSGVLQNSHEQVSVHGVQLRKVLVSRTSRILHLRFSQYML